MSFRIIFKAFSAVHIRLGLEHDYWLLSIHEKCKSVFSVFNPVTVYDLLVICGLVGHST